jgi:putative transcriptional regulator
VRIVKNRIRELRALYKLTQEQLADLIGVSRQTIYSIETEKYEPSIWLAYDISKVFNCSIEDVFIFEESKKRSRSQQSRGAV